MTLSESMPAACPCSGVVPFAGRFFAARDTNRFLDRARTLPVQSYRIVGDANFLTRSRDALELRWSHHDYLLPASFRGSLTVTPTIYGSEITLTGAGPAASPRLLRAAMRSLLQQIVAHVEREWQQFEASCASVATCNVRSMRSNYDGALEHAQSAVGSDREQRRNETSRDRAVGRVVL
jgi:hypothetical protein